ncbi:MAG: methionyl-tRNA formyltransferase [Patescibacteria group bacterium]
MRVVFFGTPTLARSILEALVADSEIDVVGVVCQPDEPVGRKAILTAPPTKQFAMEHSIPVFQPTKLKGETFLSAIDSLHADIAVVLAYGRILPQILLDRIPSGFINVHPSLLPKYRGPSPIQAAILSGDFVTGVSIMKLDAGMDTGPLLAQSEIDLADDETSETLIEKVINLSAPLLIETLKGYIRGTIAPIAQSTEGVSICKMLSREDGKIDWNEPAVVIDRKVRALTPWPGTSTTWTIGGKDVGVKILKTGVRSLPFTSAHDIGIPRSESGKLLVDCTDGTLEILELQPAGGKAMSGADFVRGHLK